MYGKLYNWHAVNDPRKLAPVGWHIPSYKEWTKLIDYLGGTKIAGSKLKTSYGWTEDKGNNESGFEGLPGGRRYLDDAKFNFIKGSGEWWSSSKDEETKSFAWHGSVEYFSDSFYMSYEKKGCGLSVRCIKD